MTTFREHSELGDVTWNRDFDKALQMAARESKPVMLLFQEVPGCSTCVNFGQNVLGDPLMVELIADTFVPVAIYNNHPGADAAILARFNEPAWNNPVVHFLAPDGAALVPKLANRYDAVALHEKIIAVRQAWSGGEIPGFAKLLGRDLLVDYGLSQMAIYETPCFWSGETSLAQHPAVLVTDAGWIDGEEVVRVQFDPRAASRAELDAFARDEGFAATDRPGFGIDEQPQYYLGKSPYAFLPLSAAQRTAINLALPYQQDAEALLSPQQRRWLHDAALATHSQHGMYRRDLRTAWEAMRLAF